MGCGIEPRSIEIRGQSPLSGKRFERLLIVERWICRCTLDCSLSCSPQHNRLEVSQRWTPYASPAQKSLSWSPNSLVKMSWTEMNNGQTGWHWVKCDDFVRNYWRHSKAQFTRLAPVINFGSGGKHWLRNLHFIWHETDEDDIKCTGIGDVKDDWASRFNVQALGNIFIL